MKATVDWNFCENASATFTGEFKPYWGGIRYRSDGSGDPPEPEEFDIESGEFKGNVADLIYQIDEYYYDIHRNLINKIKEEILKLLERHEINLKISDNEFYWITNHVSNIDPYLDNLSYNLAEKLQGINDNRLAEEERMIDQAMNKLKEDKEYYQ